MHVVDCWRRAARQVKELSPKNKRRLIIDGAATAFAATMTIKHIYDGEFIVAFAMGGFALWAAAEVRRTMRHRGADHEPS